MDKHTLIMEIYCTDNENEIDRISKRLIRDLISIMQIYCHLDSNECKIDLDCCPI